MTVRPEIEEAVAAKNAAFTARGGRLASVFPDSPYSLERTLQKVGGHDRVARTQPGSAGRRRVALFASRAADCEAIATRAPEPPEAGRASARTRRRVNRFTR